MAIQDAIVWIQGQMQYLAGVRKAYVNPPGKIAQDLATVAYPPSGTLEDGNPEGKYTGLHNVRIEFHIPLKDLARDYARLVPYIELGMGVIAADPTWGGTCNTTVGPIEYVLTPIRWAEQDKLMLRFTVVVKIIDTL